MRLILSKSSCFVGEKVFCGVPERGRRFFNLPELCEKGRKG